MNSQHNLKNNELQIIGERIRLARMNAQLTQGELAEKTGLSLKTIQRYESGLRSMDAIHLARIAKAVEVAMEWFCMGETVKIAARSPFADVEDIIAQFSLEQFRFYCNQMAVTAKNIFENYRAK
jgi:transcriptional regulator with XRE-family HTH domain